MPPMVLRVYIRLPTVYLRVYIRLPTVYLRVVHASHGPQGGTCLPWSSGWIPLPTVYLRVDTSPYRVPQGVYQPPMTSGCIPASHGREKEVSPEWGRGIPGWWEEGILDISHMSP